MNKVYLECSLSLDCYKLPRDGSARPSVRTRDRTVWHEWKTKEGFCWLMFKSQAFEVGFGFDHSALRSLVFCSTTTSTQVPTRGLDLLMPFMHRLRDIWTDNIDQMRSISNTTVSHRSCISS